MKGYQALPLLAVHRHRAGGEPGNEAIHPIYCTHTHTRTRCVIVLAASFPGLHPNIRERGSSYLRELCNACAYTHPLPTPSPCMTIHYGPGLCSPPQYNTLKTHQFLLGTVSLVAAFHCTHSPTRNGIHPVTLDHQNIRFSNINLRLKIRAGNLIPQVRISN